MTSLSVRDSIAVVSVVLLTVHGAAVAQATRGAFISIVPIARVCPGQQVEATYVEHFPDGSQGKVSSRDVRQLTPKDGDSVTVARDGSWQTNADPMRSVLTGFPLSASLARDSSVRGDTVAAPSYDCPHDVIKLPMSDRFHFTHAYVRLGTFRTPFYDSVVVAVIELDGRVLGTRVLSPAEMRSGAIKITALGKPGVAGHSGSQGSPGSDCSNGEQGTDGEPGEAGQAGGQVDIIVQEGSPWLANLVAVSNTGGRGGKGGEGGAGGPASAPSSRTGSGSGGSSCRPRPGRPGRSGAQGPDGEPGQPPKVTSAPVPLLWTGSPIWSNPVAKRALDGLMAYEPKK